MTLTTLQQIRLAISDKPIITRETSRGDGLAKYFRLGNSSIQTTPAPEVRVDGILKTDVADYAVNYDQGIITFVATPIVNSTIDFIYYWTIFTDEELQSFLDDAGGNRVIASANALMAWAADAAKVAKRQTMSGGGGLGQVVMDTAVTAKELRATAQAIIAMEKDLGESIPAEGLTEVGWNEFNYRKIVDQEIIRES
jgi:hypothetical protein